MKKFFPDSIHTIREAFFLAATTLTSMFEYVIYIRKQGQTFVVQMSISNQYSTSLSRCRIITRRVIPTHSLARGLSDCYLCMIKINGIWFS